MINIITYFLWNEWKMLSLILLYLFKRHKCQHDKITPDNYSRFCPDCGEEIDISWYVARCSHCGAKRKSNLYLNSVVPADAHCSRCGSKSFYVEKRVNPEFFDLQYCVLVKEVVSNNSQFIKQVQVWVDNEDSSQKALGLIPLHL